MRTDKHTRKTMPESWINFFKNFKGKKYFEDNGYQCCVYKPESGTYNNKLVVQTAIRRSHGKASHLFKKEVQEKFNNALGINGGVYNFVYITNASMHGGIFVYDLISMRKKGWCFERKDHKDYVTRDRGVNDYYNVPLDYCAKFVDVWDMPKILCGKSLYSCAQWQYEELIRKDEFDNCLYDNINTWEDLPDWCFWKYHEVDGSLIEGREEKYNEYVAKCKKDARYIPIIQC